MLLPNILEFSSLEVTQVFYFHILSRNIYIYVYIFFEFEFSKSKFSFYFFSFPFFFPFPFSFPPLSGLVQTDLLSNSNAFPSWLTRLEPARLYRVTEVRGKGKKGERKGKRRREKGKRGKGKLFIYFQIDYLFLFFLFNFIYFIFFFSWKVEEGFVPLCPLPMLKRGGIPFLIN